MHLRSLLFSFGILGLAAGTAAAGRPTWCGNRNAAEPRNGIRSEAERRIKNQSWTANNIEFIAQLSCDNTTDAKLTTELDEWRTAFEKEIGVTGTDATNTWKLRLDDKAFAEQSKQTCAALTGGGERDAAIAEAQRLAAGCSGGVLSADWRKTTRNFTYWIDADATPPSELARVAVVEQCLDNSYKRTYPDPFYDSNMKAYVRCGADARRLDRAKLDAELADGKFTEAARQLAREAFDRAQLISTQLETAYRKKGKEDAMWQTLFFDAPEMGWKDWETLAAAHPAELAAVHDFEIGYFHPTNRRATDGCGAKLRPLWQKYFAAQAPKDAVAAELVVTGDPIGEQLFSRLVACDLREGRFIDVAAANNLMKRARLQRGPRRAAMYAVVEAANKLQKDRNDKIPFDMSMLRFGDPQLATSLANEIGYGKDAEGEILSIAKQGADLLVKFKTVKWQVEIQHCVDTDQLYSVSVSGNTVTPNWYQSCTPAGTETRTFTEEPLVVPAQQTAGLKVGEWAKFRVDYKAKPVRTGAEMEIFADKSKKKLVAYYGVAL